jgi:hypothetical protein
VYVPAEHVLHGPEVQLAVKPLFLIELSEVNRTRRCCPVAAYVASAGAPLSFASLATPDGEHAASAHSSTYTLSYAGSVEKDVNDTEGLVPLMVHQHSSLFE